MKELATLAEPGDGRVEDQHLELPGAICCLVERRHSDAVATAARRIAVTLDLETEVTVS